MASGKTFKSEGRGPLFPADSDTLCPLINMLPECSRGGGGGGGVAVENSTPPKNPQTSIKQVKHSCWVSATFLPHWKHNHCQSTLMETAQGRGDKKSLNLIFLHTAAAQNDTRAQKKPLCPSPPGVRGQRGREKAAQQTFIQDTRRQQAEAAFLHTHTHTHAGVPQLQQTVCGP